MSHRENQSAAIWKGLTYILYNNAHIFYLLIIFIFCELIVNPLGEFPLNDDWSYSKSVYLLYNTGMYEPGDWGAMTLFTHLIWGFSFCKLFGFSFFALRLSTLVSSFAGACMMYHLIHNHSKNKTLAYTGSLAILLNPLYFNLSNTYMTDVNFTTLIISGCLFAFRFITTKRTLWLLPFTLISIAAVLTRQYGVILPVSLLLAVVLQRKPVIRNIFFTIAIIIISIAALKIYESQLKNILAEHSAYKFSTNINLFDLDFWNAIARRDTRYGSMISQILLYLSPVLLIFLPAIYKKAGFRIVAFSVVIGFLIAFFVLRKPVYYTGNILGNMYLGTETFYETLKPDAEKVTHTYTDYFANWFKVGQIMLLTIDVAIFINILYIFLFLNKHKIANNPWAVFLIMLFFMYVFMIMITESYFDRYILPLIVISILALSWISKSYSPKIIWAIIPMATLFYISVFGTKDYLTVNRTKWQAYNDLKSAGVNPDQINGGFEINCWDEGRKTWWSKVLQLNHYTYLIQYTNEKGFVPYREYEFQRYFPYKKDTINIFVRDSLDQN